MHYPYQKEQSSLLVSGKRTFLKEAYTLDDAPGYEIFIFVVSQEPLDAKAIFWEAGIIAEKSNANEIEKLSKAIFVNCEVETITLLKTNDNKE